MGRLFWRFFAIAWLVQAATIGVTGAYLGFLAPQRALARTQVRELSPSFAPGGADRSAALRARGPHGVVVFGIPITPIVGGLVASLASAALIAWYVAKPVRSLKAAIDAASHGNLQSGIAQAIGSRRDELADLGRDFDRMAERLMALIDSQQRLLHDVSHEMRSPLARVQVAIGLARQEPDLTRAAMERIEREAVRMDALVGGLLTLSRLRGGFVGSMDERIDIDELVTAIADDACLEAEAKQCRLILSAGSGGMLVQGNAELLRRGVENVVRNAIKYTFEGGSVMVQTYPASDGRHTRVTILDEGPGVPEPDLAAIFQPFFRGSGASNHEGHGLGLAIAWRAIEAHGGSIQATNRHTGGLCVRIELPLTETTRRRSSDPFGRWRQRIPIIPVR